MSQLEYLTTFVAIVIGIAVTNLMTSLHRLIVARRQVRWHPLPLLWVALLFLLVIAYWWGNYHVFQENDVLFLFAFELLGPILLFLAAGAALPDDAPSRPSATLSAVTASASSEANDESAGDARGAELNLLAYYVQQRRYFFAMVGLFLLHETVDVLLHRLVDPAYGGGTAGTMAFRLAGVGLCGVLGYSRSRPVHVLGTALAVGLTMAYVLLFEFQFGGA